MSLTPPAPVVVLWALRSADVRRTIASLWPVDDVATADLMKAFYARVVRSEPYGAALTAAKRLLASNVQWRHPYFWAPFILIGD